MRSRLLAWLAAIPVLLVLGCSSRKGDGQARERGSQEADAGSGHAAQAVSIPALSVEFFIAPFDGERRSGLFAVTPPAPTRLPDIPRLFRDAAVGNALPPQEQMYPVLVGKLTGQVAGSDHFEVRNAIIGDGEIQVIVRFVEYMAVNRRPAPRDAYIVVRLPLLESGRYRARVAFEHYEYGHSSEKDSPRPAPPDRPRFAPLGLAPLACEFEVVPAGGAVEGETPEAGEIETVTAAQAIHDGVRDPEEAVRVFLRSLFGNAAFVEKMRPIIQTLGYLARARMRSDRARDIHDGIHATWCSDVLPIFHETLTRSDADLESLRRFLLRYVRSGRPEPERIVDEICSVVDLDGGAAARVHFVTQTLSYLHRELYSGGGAPSEPVSEDRLRELASGFVNETLAADRTQWRVIGRRNRRVYLDVDTNRGLVAVSLRLDGTDPRYESAHLAELAAAATAEQHFEADIAWGEAVNGLQVGIAVLGPVAFRPEHTHFRLCQRNVGEAPLRVLRMDVRRSYYVGLYEVTTDGRPAQSTLALYAKPDPPASAYLNLAPGEEDCISETLVLARSWDLTLPCRTKIRLIVRNERSEIMAYEAEGRHVNVVGLWTGAACSRPISVDIRANGSTETPIGGVVDVVRHVRARGISGVDLGSARVIHTTDDYWDVSLDRPNAVRFGERPNASIFRVARPGGEVTELPTD